ncbi:MAG: MerR family transcriptional regulator, partial [Candidatus Eisenbacteria bacterium]|nr:MerR family transcriptional regulator [Candidatus Latescibacterota bacterium]MBD3302769.1 MerR family transcriptional regulator [Candidatus Eisenbacteria bacterium]
MTSNRSAHRTQGHPIKVVAKRTGLSPEVLRVWEKRYGVVQPTRTPTGRRLYSEADIERLRLVRQATLAGRRVGEVASLSTDSLAALVREDEREASRAPAGNGEEAGSAAQESLMVEAMSAVRDLDSPRLEAILTRALLIYGSEEFIERVAAPLLEAIGAEWEAGRLEPYLEHAATAVIRQVVG